MTPLKVIVDPATLRFDRRDVTGGLWLSLEGQAFPEAGWDDFPVVILAAWAHAIAELLDGQGSRELMFQDGLHRVEVSDAGGGEARIRLLRAYELKASASINLVDLAIQIEKAAGIVDLHCRGMGRADSDVAALRAGVDRLRIIRS